MNKNYLKYLLSYLLSTLFFLIPSCSSGGQIQNVVEITKENQLPTRRDLRNTYRQKGSLTIVYPASEKYETYFQDMVKKLNTNERFTLKVKGVKTTDFKKTQLKEEILLFIGSPSTNPILKELEQDLPLKLNEESFVFDGKKYSGKSAILKLFTYPNPHNQTLPLYLITGNDDEYIHQFLESNHPDEWSWSFWSSWGYEIHQKGKKEIVGYLSEDTWEVDKKTHYDFTAKTDTVLKSTHFRFINHNTPLPIAKVERIAKKCEANYTAILGFAGKKINLSRIDYHFFPTVENKAMQGASMQEATANIKENRIDVVMNDNFQGSFLHQENKLILNKLLGEPQLVALEEGLSNHFTQQWQQKGYEFWCQKLLRSGNLPPLKELLNNDFYKKESYLVMGAMAGVFVDFLIEKHGQRDFVKNYKTWSETDLIALEEEWQIYLKKIEIKDINIISTTVKTPTSESSETKPTYLKGFNFAHEGYRIFNGYGSNLAKESLQRIDQLGSNAIAIVPYSFMRNPKRPDPIPIIQGTGGENDQAVLFSHFEAQKMGMHTMLKPQIWVGRSWPGDIEMDNEKDWAKFFDTYYRWTRHYALLAEINGLDSYCIGVEFAKATLAKEQEWRKIIRKIRGIYNGKLTYAANWGDEFENLKFWDELDFIGLNCYYPLSKSDNPSKRQLRNEFNKILNKVEGICEKYNKQLVFTEIGFRSVEETWKNPHAEADGREFNEETQRLCYEVVFEGIKNKDWCSGILWWKWPSYLNHRGFPNTGFTPNQKKTEDCIIKYFKTKNK